MTNTPESIVYSARAIVRGGRQGEGFSHNPDITLKLATPKVMGGDGEGTNPEQIFAIGYGACFQGALALASKDIGISSKDSVVGVNVGLGPEGESFAITVDIEVFVPDVAVEDVQKLADRTHELCPYSKATRGNVQVNVTAVESAPRG
ncbi:MAG: Ohr family peroxiredoxin [Actinomycetaceae bacterium]|nr:Ohr family peroxiredoxin [Actinomycetaceae bacterium]